MDQRPGSAKPQPGYAQGDNAAGQNKNAPAQQPVKKEVQVSQTTKERAEAAKEFIESTFRLRVYKF